MNAYDKEIKELIDRYVYDVVRRLPSRQRADIERELRTLIDDMMEERSRDGLPFTKKDINVVAAELGSPAELAAKYNGNSRALIGPELYPKYLFLLRIVLICVAFGITLASVIDAAAEGGGPWLLFGKWLGTLFSGLLSAVGGVTLVFAVMERHKEKVLPALDDFSLGSLPPVPQKKERISKAETIVSMVFITLFALLFLLVPHWMAVFHVDGGELATVPVFNLPVLRAALPWLLAAFALGIVREAIKLVEGRYTLRLALGVCVIDILSLALVLVFFTGYPVWNPQFAADIAAVFELGPDFKLLQFWDIFTRYFICIFILAYLLEIGTTLYRGFRYRG